VGDPDGVRAALKGILARTQADEIMFAGQIFDHTARLHSFSIGAEVARSL
jgi:alkanesulfonate monooxygenase SsuD/methylene tetrahydromethanopterin reductase-like flavin-dependent oxidoreductase (luciferase family)